MVEARGTTWRAEYGELAEREQFRVGYVGSQSYEGYFPIGQLSDLIAVLTTASSAAVPSLTTGTAVQARTSSTGFRIEVAVEPRSDQFPVQIMRFDRSLVGDLISTLTALSGMLSAGPGDWDNTKPFPIPLSMIPLNDIVSSPQLSATIGEVGDARYPLRGQTWDPADFGAFGGGVADDTAALQACLDECAADGGGDVVLRARAYKISDTLVVPDYVRIRGAWSRRYTGDPTTGARIVAASASAPAGRLVDVRRGSKVQDIALIGAGKANSPQHDGARFVSGLGSLESVSISGCANGVDANYKSVNEVVGCQLHDNAVYGLVDPVDSKITRCFINVNNGGGIRLAAGANDNAIYDNKIEWNGTSTGGRGITATGCVNNKIVLNVFDRNAGAALRFTSSCSNTTISNNIFRRNGRYGNTLGSEEDVHIWMQGCTSFTLTANVYRTGEDDGGGGYLGPSYVFGGNTNTDCDFSAQITATGGTVGIFNFTGTNTGMRYAGNTGTLDATTGVTSLGQLGSSNIATATAWISSPLRIATTAMSTSNPGRLVALELWARSTTGGTARHVAICYAVVGREGGNAFVTLGAVVNHVGTAWALTGGQHNLSATVSADGRDLTVTVANDSAATQQYRVVMR